ncbi:MAG: cytochrome c biogenesis protein CcdA [Victivallaceae bacterium]|nr:cytochrome c biogenesis protein CcdA [Victivallaceae bacterium]
MRSAIIALALLLTALFSAEADETFNWSFNLEEEQFTISVQIPEHHYLYQDQTKIIVNSADKSISAHISPIASKYDDEFSGETMIYTTGNVEWKFNVAKTTLPYRIELEYAGCRATTPESSGICFMPQHDFYVFDGKMAKKDDPDATPTGKLTLLESLKGFKILNSAGGYMGSSDFLKFLNREDTDFFAGKSMLVIIFLIVIGGLGLNLTPCILPMIPINLAIIGADTGDRKQGFMRGLFYGVGIALAYGVLGLLSMLAGARFGALNSSPWFNFSIAAVFLILSFAMFGIINIDFSKFSTKVSADKMHVGKFLLPIFMGVIAALLAGACVAPVVIAVLLLSVNLYSAGNWSGLLLPFLLGVGMALPWPLAGAGLAVLPKPGQWMERVKQFFGILIVAAGLWFAWQGWGLLPAKSDGTSSVQAEIVKLETALNESKRSGKPIFIDFWASWCKNCLAMESTTLSDAAVKNELNNYITVKFQAEDLGDPQIKQVLDYFEAKGLPHFVILK